MNKRWSMLTAIALIVVLTALAILGPGLSAVAAPVGAPLRALPLTEMPPLPEASSTLVGSTRTVNLWALAGSLTMPGGTTVPVWGFADSVSGPALVPGPIIRANAGETLEIVFHNQIAGQTISMAFPGQVGFVPDTTGVPSGGTATYTFQASTAGTFLYDAGPTSGGARQVAMGLAGPLIVQSATPTWDQEVTLVLGGLDPAFNSNPTGFSLIQYRTKYWLLNGRAYPQTGWIGVTAGQTVLMRYLNAGVEHYGIGLLGMVGQETIALDGEPLTYPQGTNVQQIAPGQTVDALVRVPASAPLDTAYALYNASLHQHNNNQRRADLKAAFGGMLAFLQVTTGGGPVLQGPTASNVTVAPGRTNGTVDVILSATLTDDNTNVVAYETFIDTLGAPGTGTAGAVAVPAPSVNVQATFLAAQIAALADGSHRLYIRGQDADGNWGAAGSAVIALDKVGPTVSALVLNPSPTNGGVDTLLTGTAVETTTGNSLIAAAQYRIDGGAWQPMGIDPAGATSASLSATIPAATIAGLAEGSRVVEVQAQDDLGNWGAIGSINLIVDKTGAAISAVAASPNPTGGATTVTLTGTATDPVVTGTASGSNIVAAEWFVGADPGVGAGTAMSAADGAFDSPAENLTAAINISAWANGNYTLSVRARDAAGNWSAVGTVGLAKTVSDLIFSDGFESGNVSAWSSESDTENDQNVTAAAALQGTRGLAALIDNNTSMYLQDVTPAGEAQYHARFYFDPNSITMTSGNAHLIFVARNNAAELVRVEFRRNGTLYQVRASVRSDAGGYATTSWYTISDAPHPIEIAWQASTAAGANNGILRLYTDGVLRQSLLTVDNDTLRVEAARLGPLAGIDTGTRGTEYFDSFVSTRTTVIGP